MSTSLVLSLALLVTQLLAAPVYYTQWTSTPINDNGVTKYQGTINVNGVIINVKYTPSSTIAGLDAGTGTNYWATTSTKPSPYLSSYVDNLPPASHLIRIFEFSQAVSGLVLAVVSVNSNSYVFDKDFAVYSYGDGTINAPGYWGPGTLVRTVTPDGKFSLGGAGEPHGVIGIPGSYTSLRFASTNSESWNGFTVGVFGLTPVFCTYSSVTVTVPADPGSRCPAPALQCTKLLSALPRASQPSQACEAKNTAAVPFTLTTPGQKVYLAGRADGTDSPGFDELAVLKVATPSNKVFGRNLIAWEADCRDRSLDDTRVDLQLGEVINVTGLFNGEVGEFVVYATVFNKYGVYSNTDVFVCTGSGLPKSIVVAELAEIGAANHPGAGAGLSVGEIVAICVGSVVGTLLVIAGIGFVGYRVASRKSTKSELNEKFVLH